MNEKLLAMDKKLYQRADKLRKEETKETLISIVLEHQFEVLEISELAFGDMYEGREPFTSAETMERLKEFETKAYYFDNCVELLTEQGKKAMFDYIAMLIGTKGSIHAERDDVGEGDDLPIG